MQSSNLLQEILTNIATQLPSLLTIVGGIVIAILRWRRHPGVSLTLAIGLALMLLHLLVFAVVYAVLPTLTATAGFETVKMVGTLVSLVFNVMLAILTAVLLVAVFMQRPQPPEEPLYEPVAQARAA